MARIAANFAGNNPTAWDATVVANDAVLKTKYNNQIIAGRPGDQLQAGRHERRRHDRRHDFTPTFTDRNGNGKTTDIGDTGEVADRLSFRVITPGIANIVGGTVKVAAARASRSRPG